MLQHSVIMAFKLKCDRFWIFILWPTTAMGLSLFLQKCVSLKFTMVSYSLKESSVSSVLEFCCPFPWIVFMLKHDWLVKDVV